ncbi:hypothetical protein EC991_007699 [Linnemannia zychae]|nr:hypothetical protein EC991_007699 [Linnemannia zychae]
MSQPDITLDHVQAFRSVHKSLPPSTISAPLDSIDITHIDCHADPASEREFILWEDIQQAFDGALLVRYKTKMISFLKGPDYRSLEPRRIPAVPGVVLDVVVGGELANIVATPIRNLYSPPHIPSVFQQIQQHSTQYPKYDPMSTFSTPSRIIIPRAINRKRPLIPPKMLAKQVSLKRVNKIIKKIAVKVDLETLHANGDGPPEYFFKALKCYLTAFSQGHSHALYSVGNLFISGQDPKDSSMAMAWYLRAAEEGHIEAQFKVSEAYGKGSSGVSQDHGQAFHWVLKAAIQGHSDAQVALGDQYTYRDVMRLDHLASMDWYLKAADQGHAQAQFMVGVLYFQNKILGHFLRLDQSDGMPVKVGETIPKDDAKALEWFLKAAHQGYAYAQFGVAIAMLEIHDDLDPETIPDTVVVWCRKAAKQNHGPAQAFMGVFFMGGYGVQKNARLASKFFHKAVDRSSGVAERGLGQLYDEGNGVSQNDSKAFEWYLKSAVQGLSGGQLKVAEQYENGKGVPANREKAIEWYTKAVLSDNRDAKVALHRIIYNVSK